MPEIDVPIQVNTRNHDGISPGSITSPVGTSVSSDSSARARAHTHTKRGIHAEGSEKNFTLQTIITEIQLI